MFQEGSYEKHYNGTFLNIMKTSWHFIVKL